MAIARQKVEAYSPIGVLDLMVSSMDRGVREVPDIIEFVTSDAYLGRPQLYPRQATLLKIIFLQDELFCADEKTEILTRRGWMPYDQVREGEDVMTLSVDGHAEWSPAERINVFPVEDEPLVLMEGENHSSLTTPNHRWLVERLYQSRSGNRRDIEFIETKDLQKRDRIACAAPVANLPSERIWDDSFVELAAWYWTEGHAIAGLRGGIKITQSKRVNPEYVDRIRACLIDLFGPAQDSLWGSLDGPAWREDPADGGMVSFRLNSLASEELRFVAPGEEKIVRPDFLASLTQGQLDLYLDTSIAADGWESGGSRHLTQKSLGRIDSFQMACSLAGVRTTVRLDATRGTSKYAGRPFWSITLNEGRRYFSPQPRKETRRVGFAITEVRHTGTVWCPTTANGTWLARRNGTVYFTGNTEFDLDVIGQWCEGFVAPDPDRAKAMVQGKKYRFEGEWGIQPDVLERIRINKADGRKWFREVVAAVGRRGSKGFLGAFCGAYVLAHFVMRGDVHKTYGIDPGKRFAAFVYAAKKGQAIENQWGDLNRVITEAPFFQQRMGRAMSESLSIKGAEDDTRMRKMNAAGVFPLGDRSTFLIDPKESTMVSGRGPASFMQFYDEMAHITREVAKADAKQIYDQAKPALDQFGKDAFIYEGSSTWQMLGQFYENWENALEIDPITHAPKRPNMLMFQLCSWDPYEDYERANDIPRVNVDFDPSVNRNYVFDRDYHIRPGAGPKTFGHMPENPPSLYDEEMRLEEEANPETFAVERRCLDPETLVLCADLTWRPIKSLTVGDEVISVDEEPLEAGKQRRMRTATVNATWRNTDTAYRLTFEDGTSVVCSGNHRWLSASKGSGGEQLASFRWRTIKADPHKPGPRVGISVGDSIRHLVDPWEEDNSWEAGYLAGVYDGEGTAIGYPRREFRVSFVQNPGETLDATLLYLKQKGFEPVHIPTKVPAQVYVIRGFADCLRFVGQMGGHKMRRQAVPHLWEGRGIGRAKGRSSHKIVASIEELPAQEMVDIETSTGTFLAEGLVSHNSKWATAMNAYLNAAKVDAMFEPFGPDNEIHLVQKSRGILSTMYRAHGDPSSVSANFGWAIGHVEYPEWDVRGLPHVYFDKVHAWVPREFPNGEIDYIKIGQDLQYDVRAFAPELVTFDQWNCLDGQTLVPTEDGLLTVEEIVGDLAVGKTRRQMNLGVQSMETPAMIAAAHHKGRVPVRQLTTKLGSRISVTGEHRLWVRKAKAQAWHPDNEWGWLEADQIEEGDWLSLRRHNLMPVDEVDLTDLHPDSRGSSPHWGVAREGGRWLAFGNTPEGMVRLGYFDDEGEAALVAHDWRQEHPTSRRITRYPKTLDGTLGRLLGYVIAEGWVGSSFSLTNRDREVLDDVQGCLEESFGGDWSYAYDDFFQGTYSRGVISSQSIAPFLHELGCGGLAKEKRVPALIRKSPAPVVAAFLRGLFEGDGGVTITKTQGEWVHLTSVSRELIEDVQQLLLSLGVFSSVWRGTYQYKGETRDQARVCIYGQDLLDFERLVGFCSSSKKTAMAEAATLVRSRPSSGRRSMHQRHGDHYWVRVVDIEETEADCYDLSVPGPESFIANGVVSHNSISTIQEMRADVRDNPLPNHVVIEERTATNELNWRTAETFKVALNLGLIHAPHFDLAREELKFLQDLGNKKIDKPSTGPVQTKDVADCYDDQTEVLTYSGWKLFADVQEGEPVATRSPSGVLEFQIPTAGVARPYSGPMYTYDGERLNFAVTPGHRMLVSTYEAPDWRFVEAKDLTSKRYRVPKTASPLDPVDGWMDFDADQRACVVNTCQEGRGGHGRPSWTKDEDGYLSSMYASSPMEDLCSILGRSRGAIYGRAKKLGLKRGQIGDRVGDLPDRLPKTDRADFAAFLGIWLAEGAKTRRGYEVLISQTKPAGIEWIDTLMVRLGWPVYRRQAKTGEVVWGVKSRGLRDYLRQCVDGSDLSIPEEVFHLWSLREREALLDGLMVGDGTSGVNGRTYYSSSRRLIDDVQRLLIHLGRQGRVRRISEAGDQRSIRGIDFVATKPGYSIHENISDTATIETDRIEQVDYAGMVYCLTVPNGTLLTRRAGIPFWAGNCLMIVVHSLIGDVMDAYIKRDLAATRLGGALQGGTLPNGSVPSVHDQLSATGNRSSSSPARTSQARRGTGGGRGATPRTSGKRRRG